MAIVATGLERAIERATQGGVRVVAEGRRKSDGARLFLVPSARDANLWHPVALIAGGERLQCDCPAGQHGRVCVHQGAVAIYLRAKVRADLERMEREAAEREVIAAIDATRVDLVGELRRVGQEVRGRDRERVVRSVDRSTGEVLYAASSWERETALPRYRTDNRPVSIWK